MKKIISILVIATLFVACGNKAEAPAVSVDSVKIDSVKAVDSIKVDSVKIDSSSVK
jgi:hypothetical protein